MRTATIRRFSTTAPAWKSAAVTRTRCSRHSTLTAEPDFIAGAPPFGGIRPRFAESPLGLAAAALALRDGYKPACRPGQKDALVQEKVGRSGGIGRGARFAGGLDFDPAIRPAPGEIRIALHRYREARRAGGGGPRARQPGPDRQ